MKKLKVMTIVGTRPEIIRLSRVIPKLDSNTQHLLVHTGQNFDPALKDVFFADLELRVPDYYLDVDNSSFGAAMADVLRKTELLLRQETPDAVVILGDTNSAIAAVPAERLGIPVYHLEAGNRAFDANVPEELNRKLVDHVATFNLPYSHFAEQNLIREGIEPKFIHRTGSPMAEVLEFAMKRVDREETLGRFGLEDRSYFLMSLHRQENVDNESSLRSTLAIVGSVAKERQRVVVLSAHPRLQRRINEFGIELGPEFDVRTPLGYLDFLALQVSSECVISDSGSLAEESTLLGFPSINLRHTNERQEAWGSSTCVICPPNRNSLEVALTRVLAPNLPRVAPRDYQGSDFSERVVAFILNTAQSHRFLKGLRPWD